MCIPKTKNNGVTFFSPIKCPLPPNLPDLVFSSLYYFAPQLSLTKYRLPAGVKQTAYQTVYPSSLCALHSNSSDISHFIEFSSKPPWRFFLILCSSQLFDYTQFKIPFYIFILYCPNPLMSVGTMVSFFVLFLSVEPIARQISKPSLPHYISKINNLELIIQSLTYTIYKIKFYGTKPAPSILCSVSLPLFITKHLYLSNWPIPTIRFTVFPPDTSHVEKWFECSPYL